MNVAMYSFSRSLQVSTLFIHKGHRQGFTSLLQIVNFWLHYPSINTSIVSASREVIEALNGDYTARTRLEVCWVIRSEEFRKYSITLDNTEIALIIQFRSIFRKGTGVSSSTPLTEPVRCGILLINAQLEDANLCYLSISISIPMVIILRILMFH